MHRRSFLTQCGLAMAGSLFLPAFSPTHLQAADLPNRTVLPQKASTGALIPCFSTFSAKVSVWDAAAFTRATGLEADAGTVHLLVRVDDLQQLVRFFASASFKSLGVVHVIDNTLNFTYRATDYTVTNALPKDFTRLASGEK